MTLISSLITEFVASFIFVFSVVCIGFNKEIDTNFTPLYIGLALTISIMIAKGINGFGHLNPLGTIANTFNGAVTIGNAAGLIVVQIIAACLAYFTWKGLGVMSA